MPVSSRFASNRIQWMDFLRGAAILLVLLWHAPAIPVLYGFEMPPWVRATNDFMMPFRMPMLMFLSGMLLSKSLQRNLVVYYRGKLVLLGWPYLVWAFIHILQFGEDLSVTSPRSWVATGYLWFLFFVMAFYFLAPLIRWAPDWCISILSFSISVYFDGELTTGFFYFLGFFYAGSFFANSPRLLVYFTSGWRVPACGAVAVGLGIWSALDGPALKYEAFTAMGSLSGIIAAIGLCKLLPDSRFRNFFERIGQKSIVHYVSHFPIIIAVTLGMRALGVSSFGVVVVAGFVSATCLGLLLARLSDQAPISWLFRFPVPSRRRGRRRAESTVR
ncbi:acyltransferase family protein [Paenarthrobacter ureafaciens]